MPLPESPLGGSPIIGSLSLPTAGGLGVGLMGILMGEAIVPGATPSYELCKLIYLYHPLGQKMAESPVKLAQSQERKITVNDAPDEVLDAFRKEWGKIDATGMIKNAISLSRVYGISSIVLGAKMTVQNEETGEKATKDFPADQPLPMEKIWDMEIFFNVLDPLNTAGSLVLSQTPTEPDFLKPVVVRVRDQVYHRSRYQVLQNECPVYLAYTTSAFGFVGRSVYQRALFPLKSFIRTMIADDMIATKLGLIVAKQKPPGAVLDRVMQRIAALKRSLLKQAQTNNVLSIDIEEEIETLDMQNVDGAGTYSRGNILKNIATSADMPAIFLENETMTEGFGEGTEDAKNIAHYINGVRMGMQPVYGWLDNIVQYRAWNPAFFEYIKTKYPEEYSDRKFEDAFSQWRSSFSVEWPSLLIEPESEKATVEKVKMEAIIAVVEAFGQLVDPENKAKLLQWAADNLNEEEMLFPHALDLDWESLADFQQEQQEQEEEQLEAVAEGARKGVPAGAPGGKGGEKVGLNGKPQGAKAPPGGNGGGAKGALAAKMGKFSG